MFVSLNLMVALIFVFTPYFGHFTLVSMLIYALSPLWTWRLAPEVSASETRYKKA